MKKLDLDGLVVIGGDDSNTNACLLAENFRSDSSYCFRLQPTSLSFFLFFLRDLYLINKLQTSGRRKLKHELLDAPRQSMAT